MSTPPARRLPPRLVVRALLASFLTVSLILGAVFILLSIEVRQRIRQSVVENLDAGQRVFVSLENRREQDRLATVSTLAENPTLKAALDTWQTERRSGSVSLDESLRTVQREMKKIGDRVEADVLAILDARGEVVASAGTHAGSFAPGTVVPASDNGQASSDSVVVVARDVFRMMSVPLDLGDARIGSFELGTALDFSYAQELATLARAHSAIVIGERVQATTLPPAAAAAIGTYVAPAGTSSIVQLGGAAWAVRQFNKVGPATFLALAPVDAAADEATRAALQGLAWIGVVALAFAGFGSLWLARTLTDPIDQLSQALTAMTVNHRFDSPVPSPGTSRELDALAATFNDLIKALARAEADTQAAYLGAIRALAAALDARDPYTAGHSERVSALSVEMGRGLQLDDAALGTLRLGALLHDIGKIGVPDEVLRKESALSPSEFDLIRAHPVIGARILRSIPFLTPHLPIVELHHERPDGHGYPYGLSGDAIPFAARIVHVADAYDAMTSARAYRPGRLPHEALAELQRCIGTDFDRASVEALVAALPKLPAASATFDPAAFQWAAPPRTTRAS